MPLGAETIEDEEMWGAASHVGAEEESGAAAVELAEEETFGGGGVEDWDDIKGKDKQRALN